MLKAKKEIKKWTTKIEGTLRESTNKDISAAFDKNEHVHVVFDSEGKITVYSDGKSMVRLTYCLHTEAGCADETKIFQHKDGTLTIVDVPCTCCNECEKDEDSQLVFEFDE